jgi:two-component system nitrogen regulation sensor histidine kinase NtrY
LLQAVYRLLQAQLKHRQIAWHWQLAPQALVVAADAPQMEQVLINIVKNALESIDAQGQVTVRTTLQPPALVVADNGAGVPEAIRQHLFTPFFSTKKKGQGIGLTMIRDILVHHGFPFSLATDQDGITAFQINF